VKGVCPSVCLSVKRVDCDKTEEKSVQIFIPYERLFIPVFREKEWLVGNDPFYLKFWVKLTALERNRQFSVDVRSVSAVTPSEKSSINTNSLFCLSNTIYTRFPMSLKWSFYVAPKPPKRASKTQNGRFRCKIALRLKKVCYKVSLCENYQQQSWPNYPCKDDWWRRPLLPEILSHTDRFGAKSPILDLFSPVAPHIAKKSSIPMWLRWTSYVVCKPPKGAQKRSVQNLNNKPR